MIHNTIIYFNFHEFNQTRLCMCTGMFSYFKSLKWTRHNNYYFDMKKIS